MKLKKCQKCNAYNLTDICRKCKTKTKSAHYKFSGLKDAPNTFKRR